VGPGQRVLGRHQHRDPGPARQPLHRELVAVAGPGDRTADDPDPARQASVTSGARAGSPEVAIPASETVPGLVTVAIPARNESASIRRVLDAVRSQTYPDLQIVVVDGSSEDD